MNIYKLSSDFKVLLLQNFYLSRCTRYYNPNVSLVRQLTADRCALQKKIIVSIFVTITQAVTSCLYRHLSRLLKIMTTIDDDISDMMSQNIGLSSFLFETHVARTRLGLTILK